MSSFYITGGTLQHDAPSYVERQADRDLLDGLLQGEFCYVLTSRQMGKSSLMVRTASKLREQGINVIVLDLTAIGQNLTPEQWYDGLVVRMGRQLRLEDELEDFWRDHPQLGPCQRFFTALLEVVLRKLSVFSSPLSVAGDLLATTENERPTTDHGPRTTDKLVVFVDEIDTVRSLPFISDEFFAAMRECYNRRTEDVEFTRLTFCLLGVATPSDLIRDTRTTPFNIGHRIELNDFTATEAAPLAKGLQVASAPAPGAAADAQALLARILHWTGGHPYLTQRLCHAIGEPHSRGVETDFIVKSVSEKAHLAVTGAADAPLPVTPETVDRFCEELFLSPRGRERDDNLLFVRERILRSEVDLPSVLNLYEQVLAGKTVREDGTSPLLNILRLSGITRVVNGCHQVRNRIYARVFDRSWVHGSLPDAELRRQRAAFRRGVIRTASIAAVIILAMAALIWYAQNQTRLAQEGERTSRRNLYAADMNAVQQALDDGNLGRARALLDAHRPRPDQNDLRGFEWRYFWKLCLGDPLAEFRGHSNVVTGLAFSPDGRILASASWDNTVKLWDAPSRQLIATLAAHSNQVVSVALSPDGQFLASGSDDGYVKLWNLATRQVAASFPAKSGRVVFSPAGALLAIGNGGVIQGLGRANVDIWNYASNTKLRTLADAGSRIAFSPDGKRLATGAAEGTIKLWDVATGREIRPLANAGDVISIAFASDGRTLAASNWKGDTQLWNLTSGELIAPLKGHSARVWSVAFSPDAKVLATSSSDQTVRLWDVATQRQLARFIGHGNEVWSVAFSPDGKAIVSSGKDEVILLWDSNARPENVLITNVLKYPKFPVFSPDGKFLAASSGNNQVVLWEVGRARPVATFDTAGAVLAFSSDGRTMVTLVAPSVLQFWDIATQADRSTVTLDQGGEILAAISPDLKTVATGDRKGRVRLLDATTGRATATSSRHTGRIQHLAFSSDGRSLATGSADKTARIWDAATLQERVTLTGHKDQVIWVEFSPDGRTVATGSADNTSKLWRLSDGKEAATLSGHKEGIYRVAFSPDGRTLASASADRTVKLWNLTTFREVAALKHENEAWFVAFSPDGLTLATSVNDGTVQLWRAPSFAETDFRKNKN